MSKIVKIEKGQTSVDMSTTDLHEFSGMMVRFTYQDGSTVYMCHDAFPDEETLISDTTTSNGFCSNFVQGIMELSKTKLDPYEAKIAESVDSWTQIY